MIFSLVMNSQFSFNDFWFTTSAPPPPKSHLFDWFQSGNKTASFILHFCSTRVSILKLSNRFIECKSVFFTSQSVILECRQVVLLIGDVNIVGLV